MKLERPLAIEKASHDTFLWLDEEEHVEKFHERWGGFDDETFVRVLDQKGKSQERVFALFALGHLATPGVASLLSPFLESSERMERWASAIALGRLKEERVLPSLQKMLLEGIGDHEEDGMEKEQAQSLAHLYGWYNFRRSTVAEVLGALGNAQAVPALRHALGACWKLEQQPGPFREGRWGYYSDYWHDFQDHLAYALGQLGAFGALLHLGLPESRLRIALTYLILGHLRVTAPEIFLPDLVPGLRNFLDEKAVMLVLAERFGLSEEEQVSHLDQLPHDAEERILSTLQSRKR